MAAGADARRGVIDLVRISLDVGDQFFQVRYRNRGVDQDDVRARRHQGDGRQIFERVIGHPAARIGIDRDRPGGGEADGVAILGGLGDEVGAQAWRPGEQ
ncbi:hypothetical protein G6F22_021245 [Rhizopus arrhizus]|nr:hypothetical protein G6F22_021245 [Rhizopus arrhizus]